MYKLKPNPNLAISIDSIPNAIDPNGSVNVKAIDQELKQLPGIQVKDIKLTDLFFPADACTGVYIFYDKGL